MELTITDGVLYSLRFNQLDPTDRVDFCDCSGNLSENTSSVMGFEPTTIVYAACDTLRIPRGDFTPDYVGHSPDTVYFEKSDDTSLYRFIAIER
ncbi:MAG: hypothetical protein JSV52_13375 [Candidatus Zixiibacteriota bacterium]|nr:MAG: hypothetical protein JSV52_13375 [candidate division Zixibacteria bacterium]